MLSPEEFAKRVAEKPVKITLPLWIVLALMVITGLLYEFWF